MKNESVLSPAMRLLLHVWNNINSGGSGGGWGRINHAMRDALTLAIGSGMRFDAEDWLAIQTKFRSAYWTGVNGFEWAYSLAVAIGNDSVYESLESHFGRPPFIADAVTPGSEYCHTPWLHGCGGMRDRERLALGFEFQWKGEACKVTSFRGDCVIACSYTPSKGEVCPQCNRSLNWSRDKLLHRYLITRDAIIADRAERKERAEIEGKLASTYRLADASVRVCGTQNKE
jgi:hypothetical protein